MKAHQPIDDALSLTTPGALLPALTGLAPVCAPDTAILLTGSSSSLWPGTKARIEVTRRSACSPFATHLVRPSATPRSSRSRPRPRLLRPAGQSDRLLTPDLPVSRRSKLVAPSALVRALSGRRPEWPALGIHT
eukprot:scaffold218614_cov35-Tisochrysis_lutea.AAC.6